MRSIQQLSTSRFLEYPQSFIRYKMLLGMELPTFLPLRPSSPFMGRYTDFSPLKTSIVSLSLSSKASPRVGRYGSSLRADLVLSWLNLLRGSSIVQNVHCWKSCCWIRSCWGPSRGAECNQPGRRTREKTAIYGCRHQCLRSRRMWRPTSWWASYAGNDVEMVLLDVSLSSRPLTYQSLVLLTTHQM